MSFSEGGGHFMEDPSEFSQIENEETQSEQKQNMVIHETYDGSEDPMLFLEKVTHQAAEKGVPLRIEDILKQADQQAKAIEIKKFSFDEMEVQLSKSIIFPNLEISAKAPSSKEESKKTKEVVEKKQEPIETEYEYEDNDDDDNDDEELPEEEKKREEPKQKQDAISTDIAKVREILDSDTGKKMEEHLEAIKQKGKLLLAELGNCTGRESEKAIRLRLLLFEDMGAAERLGGELKQTIKNSFNVTLQRDLAPILIIKSYLKRRYQKQGLTLPKELMGVEVIEGKESLNLATDDRPR